MRVRGAVVAIAVIFVVLVGCGPSEEEIAEIVRAEIAKMQPEITPTPSYSADEPLPYESALRQEAHSQRGCELTRRITEENFNMNIVPPDSRYGGYQPYLRLQTNRAMEEIYRTEFRNSSDLYLDMTAWAMLQEKGDEWMEWYSALLNECERLGYIDLDQVFDGDDEGGQ